jgi:beta-glucanase (GH16 family)
VNSRRVRVAAPIIGILSAALALAGTTGFETSASAQADTGVMVSARKAKANGKLVLVGAKVAVNKHGKLRYPVTAKFRPRHKGARVVIQKKGRKGWHNVAKGRQDGSGHFTAAVKMNPKHPRKWRAKTFASGHARSRYHGRTEAKTPDFKKRVWGDSFSGKHLNKSKWDYRLVDKYLGPYRFCSASKPRAVKVKHGKLELRVIKQHRKKRTMKGKYRRCRKHGMYYNGHIGAKQNFIYGTFAARVKFQRGQGQHGAFWVQGGENGAEIDVAEYFGNGPNGGGLSSFVHPNRQTKPNGADYTLKDRSGGIQKRAKRFLGHNGAPKRYHVYSVQWTSDGYRFMIDGKLTFKTKKPYVTAEPQFPILSLLSSDYELKKKRASHSKKNATMKVDWVKVYQ